MRNDGAALPNFMRRAFTPNSSLDSEIDVNASYLENAIRVTVDLNTTFGHRPIYTSRRF